uniref:Retrovirus-related Pol polyprotein from transposon RE1 n=1 Tax=Cannabis sativa TaxID=3483 RepID=A0A803PYD1_CANSA
MATEGTQMSQVTPVKSSSENSPPSSSAQPNTSMAAPLVTPFSNTLSQPFSLKLDRNNYPLWKTMVFTIIRGHRLKGFLTGQKTCPPESLTVPATDEEGNVSTHSLPNHEYESCIVHDQLLMGWLYGSMTEGIGSEVMGCRSAATLWTALEELYGAQSRANMDELQTKLQTTRKGDKSMAEYLRQKRICADTLAIVGDPYPEKLLRGNILSGLDAEYLSIVVPLEARAELSCQELQSTLLSYDSRLERLQSLSPNSKLLNNPSVALAQKPFGPGNRGGFQGRGSGNSNNGNNSGRGYTPQGSSSRGGSGQRGRGRGGRGNSKPTCQVCGKYGHSAAICCNRFDESYMGQPPPSEFNYSQDKQNPMSVLVATPQTLSDDSWYADSGATNHLTPDSDKLKNKVEYGGKEQMIVGDGTKLSIKHIGSNVLNIPDSKCLILKDLLHVPSITKNLISISSLTSDNDVSVEFFSDFCCVKDQTTGKVVLQETLKDGLYQFPSQTVNNISRDTNKLFSGSVSQSKSFISLKDTWHRRLGHPSAAVLNQVLNISNVKHQNRRAESKHRHIVEMGLTLLAQAKMPLKYWSDAFQTSVYLINRLPTVDLKGKSPFEVLYSKVPDYKFLKVFGSTCFPYLRPYQTHKFQYHSVKCLNLGYSEVHKGYKCLSPQGRIYISRNVTFNESEFPCHSGFFNNYQREKLITLDAPHSWFQLPSPILVTGSSDTSPSVPAAPSSPTSTQQSVSSHSSFSGSPIPFATDDVLDSISMHSSPIPSPDIHPPVQTTTAPTHPMITRAKAGIFKPKTYLSHNKISHGQHIPASVAEALQHEGWNSAMSDEFYALKRQKTWSLVPRSLADNIVGCKWIFREKFNADGSHQRLKARLVAKGFHQRPGVDFGETFSPVVKAPTIRIVLALVVSFDWEVRQIEINNAFLNGIHDEDVYMSQPEGFEDPQKPDHVCKLHKSIYGLKQAPRAWYDQLRSALLSWKFKNSKADSSFFILKEQQVTIMLLVYVDDIIVTGNNSEVLNSFIDRLNKMFSLKYLGTLHYFLGVEVFRDSTGIHLSQSKYISELLQKAKMEHLKPCATPITAGKPLSINDGKPFIFIEVSLEPYMKRILRYLKGTAHHGLHLSPSPNLHLVGFSDVDWACCPDDRKSVAGYCVYLGDSLISWSSKKQTVVARSSTESEYRALAQLAAEISWIQGLLCEMKFELPSVPVIWCDNLSASALAANPVYHARTKHIELDVHFVRDKVLDKKLEIRYVPSHDQVADCLTKSLTPSSLGIVE